VAERSSRFDFSRLGADRCCGRAVTVSLLRVKVLRAAAAHLMTIGVLSDGWYAMLTGVALLVLAYLLGGVPWDVDPAATLVGMAFLAVGLWQLTRGLRAEFPRRPKSTDGAG